MQFLCEIKSMTEERKQVHSGIMCCYHGIDTWRQTQWYYQLRIDKYLCCYKDCSMKYMQECLVLVIS